MIELVAAALLSMAPKVLDYTTRPQPRQEAGPFPDGVVLRLNRGHSLMFNIGGLKRVSVTDPKIGDVVVIGPDEIRLDGISPGSTTLIVWDRNGRTGAQVEVIPQPGDAKRATDQGVSGNRQPECSWGHALSEGYLIGPLDRLRVHRTGNEPLTLDVPADERVTFPGPVRVSVHGLKRRELAEVFARALKREAADVAVLVVRPRVPPGEGQKPPAPLVDVSPDHKLGAGDWISVVVKDAARDSSFATEVDANGWLALPGKPLIAVHGMTRRGLDDVLRREVIGDRKDATFSALVVPLFTRGR